MRGKKAKKLRHKASQLATNEEGISHKEKAGEFGKSFQRYYPEGTFERIYADLKHRKYRGKERAKKEDLGRYLTT
uniref:Uncharacterized protein n=1 Tax=viral metagenome TaxID=1070528 RepID=A0A6M3L3W7_9ZZZZ